MSNYLAASDTMTVFVDAVKKKMASEGITQAALAERIGVSRPVVARFLTKRGGNCSFQTADKIASALDTTTLDLLVRAAG